MPRDTALLWFDLDLRLADNPALETAVAQRQTIVPVFIWSPEAESPWTPGAASQWWLHQSLGQLAASLGQRGSKLIIRRGPAAEALRSLASETGARTVLWNRRYEPALIERDRELTLCLERDGIAIRQWPGNLLVEPGTLLNNKGKPFQVFTPFWTAFLGRVREYTPSQPPRTLEPPARWPSSLTVADLGLEPGIDWAGSLRENWQPGETGATTALKGFAGDAIGNYLTDRDRPDHRGTSRLSAHLHFGEISVRSLWHAAANESYRRQIAWREFSYHLLFHFPQSPNESVRPEFRSFPWRFDEKLFRAWTQGKTGYPLVDAGMRELWHTGWMHNRVRMLAASFLVKHLLIPWQEGAAWFWDTLVDADLANNTMGWQWSAGSGADAAPYFRIFNPTLQREKFDPQGDYVRRWVPELGTPEYPPPIVEHDAARRRALAAFSSLRRSAAPEP